MAKKKAAKKDDGILASKDGVTLYESVENHGPMFFRSSIGEAKEKDTGVVYQLDTNVGSGSPIVTNSKTGRRVIFDWAGLIKRAKALGIDETTPKNNKKGAK